MDLETEERVKRVVDLEMKDCTVLAVAHRIGIHFTKEFSVQMLITS
jgi:hypothetical protein